MYNSYLFRTTSKSKLLSAEFIDFHVAGSIDASGYAVALCGTGIQLDRHIRELRRKDFAESRMVFVERDAKTFASIQRRADKIGFRGKIVLGDFFTVLQDYNNRIIPVTYADYDGVERCGAYELKLKAYCGKHNIRLAITGSLRGVDPEIVEWSRKQGFRKRIPLEYGQKRRDKARRLPIIPILEKLYDSNVLAYAGANGTPMYTVVV